MKPAKCKICKQPFEKRTSLHQLCSGKCAIEHLQRQNAKRIAVERTQTRLETIKKKNALKSISEYANEAQTVFNQFIRARDEKLPCISCGRFHTGQYHAGHYRTRGSAAHLRFSEENTHKQCAPCNNHLSGNIVNYRAGLINKIGIERVEAIECNNELHRWTKEELIEIKQKYKLKLKQLKESEMV